MEMDCKKAKRAIYLFIDQEPEEDLAIQLQRHLAQCHPCARRRLFIRRVLLLVRERCVRFSAPERLRLRILTSMPHRRGEPRAL